jgi:hypothetical protein
MTVYANTNFKSKKALKEAVAKGERITCRNMTPFGTEQITGNRKEAVSGPWYPAPHTWYAEVVIMDDVIVSVK